MGSKFVGDPPELLEITLRSVTLTIMHTVSVAVEQCSYAPQGLSYDF